MKNDYLLERLREGAKARNESSSILTRKKWAALSKRVVSLIDHDDIVNNAYLHDYLKLSRRFIFSKFHDSEPLQLGEIARSADVVLIGSRLPEDRAIQSIRLLRTLRDDLTLIIMVEKPEIASFTRYFQSGVDGIYKIPGTREGLEEVIMLALQDEKPFPREISKLIAEHIAKRFAAPNGTIVTRAEAEVLEGLIKGKRDKEIASERATSPGTVHSITAGLFRKYNVTSRSELVNLFLPIGGAYPIVRQLNPTRCILGQRRVL